MNRLMAAGALLIPALVFASCSDDGNTNPVGPETPNTPGTPAIDPSKGFRLTDVHRLRFAPPAAADLAVAVKADAEAASLATASVTTTTTNQIAPHDPTLGRMRIRCLDGDQFGFPPGLSDRFRPDHEHGCELNTMAGGAGIALPFSNKTRGKRVANTTRLEFFYAGGPQNGGAPRFSIFTDFCKDPPAVTPLTNPPGTRPCGPAGSGKTTDGEWDETLFIDVNGCNDGDVYVGAVLLKSSPNSGSDASCSITEAFGADGVSGTGDEHTHTNWADYLGDHFFDRFARDFGPANGDALADNFIIADVPVHYLVYRIRMEASGT